MPRDLSATLGDHFVGFIDAQVRSGRYGSASDIVRTALKAGESGAHNPLGNKSLLTRMRAVQRLAVSGLFPLLLLLLLLLPSVRLATVLLKSIIYLKCQKL